MVSSSKPTVLTQYPRDQKCRPVTRLFPIRFRWIRTALLPFKNPITNAMLNLGGTLKHMWIWSGIRWPSINSTPRCLHRSFIICPTRARNFPYRFFLRYLGTITTWYFHSHLTCAKLCQSCIGSSSWLAPGAFPLEEPILFFAGTVEPFRVHHWKWWV